MTIHVRDLGDGVSDAWDGQDGAGPRGPLTAVKPTWIVRRVHLIDSLSWGPVGRPGVGDLLLCEVVHPSLHKRIETNVGARADLYPGDRIVCALGNRYATSYFEAAAELKGEQADLLSSSGLCGRVLHQNARAARPTSLRVLAQASLAGRPVNLRSFALDQAAPPTKEPAWIMVIGSSMDSGKTTACTSLINGLHRAGFRVGAAKLTGTSSVRDLGSFRSAGASVALDFLDWGWPSTAGCSLGELEEISQGLLGHIRAAGVDVAVLEVADGLLQPETAAFLADLGRILDDHSLIFTAIDSLGAAYGVQRLAAMGHRVAAVSGLLTNSALARRELELATGVRCIHTDDLGRNALELAGLAKQRDLDPIGEQISPAGEPVVPLERMVA